jgi:hypothetical protein
MSRTSSLRALIVILFAVCAATVAAPAAQADPTGAQSELTAVTGQGAGLIIVSPTRAGQGDFVAQVKVNIHDAAPNTTFTITRAVDAPADGICTSTDFVTVATLQASPGGAGAVEFVRTGGTEGSKFDLFLRILGSDGSVLESGCMTITVK